MIADSRVFALVVEFDWGIVNLGFYTLAQIESFRREYIGPEESVTVIDPAALEFVAA